MQKRRFTDFPEFHLWSSSFDPCLTGVDYVSQYVSEMQAFAVVDLLFPRFIEVKGCVLLEDKYEPVSFEEWFSRVM